MKTRTLKFLTLVLFFAFTNLKSQECLPETRMEDEVDNKAAAKALKFYLIDHQEKGVIIDWVGPSGKRNMGFFGNAKYLKCQYLRHTFLSDWESYTNNVGELIREAYLGVGAKAESGTCAIIIFKLTSVSLGGGKWGPMNVFSFESIHDDSYYKYINDKVDCDCILKTKDWSGSSTKINNSESTTVKATENKSETVSATSAAANTTVAKSTAGLTPLDKKKPGYFEDKDGNVVSAQGYKKNGKIDGEYRSYSDGKLEYTYTFKNGVKEGTAAEYYENGKVKEQGMYKNDQKDGEWKRFTEAGKPAGTDVYVDGEKQ